MDEGAPPRYILCMVLALGISDYGLIDFFISFPWDILRDKMEGRPGKKRLRSHSRSSVSVPTMSHELVGYKSRKRRKPIGLRRTYLRPCSIKDDKREDEQESDILCMVLALGISDYYGFIDFFISFPWDIVRDKMARRPGKKRSRSHSRSSVSVPTTSHELVGYKSMKRRKPIGLRRTYLRPYSIEDDKREDEQEREGGREEPNRGSGSTGRRVIHSL